MHTTPVFPSENSVDRGAGSYHIHGVAKSWIWLSKSAHTNRSYKRKSVPFQLPSHAISSPLTHPTHFWWITDLIPFFYELACLFLNYADFITLLVSKKLLVIWYFTHYEMIITVSHYHLSPYKYKNIIIDCILIPCILYPWPFILQLEVCTPLSPFPISHLIILFSHSTETKILLNNLGIWYRINA